MIWDIFCIITLDIIINKYTKIYIYLNINYIKNKIDIFISRYNSLLKTYVADLRCRSVECVGLTTLEWTVCGLETQPAQGYFSFLIVVFCQ